MISRNGSDTKREVANSALQSIFY